MKVLLAENAGFCFGVKLAVDSAIKTQNEYNKKIYTLGPLIYNSDVVNYLEENNIYAIDINNVDTLNKDDVKRSYNFKCDSQEVKDYLSGLTLKGNNQKGYGVIFVDGYPLSFYKESNNQVKNLYPKGLRR